MVEFLMIIKVKTALFGARLPHEALYHIDQRRAFPLKIGWQEGQNCVILRRGKKEAKGAGKTLLVHGEVGNRVFGGHHPGGGAAQKSVLRGILTTINSVGLKEFNGQERDFVNGGYFIRIYANQVEIRMIYLTFTRLKIKGFQSQRIELFPIFNLKDCVYGGYVSQSGYFCISF